MSLVEDRGRVYTDHLDINLKMHLSCHILISYTISEMFMKYRRN